MLGVCPAHMARGTGWPELAMLDSQGLYLLCGTVGENE